MRRLGLAAAGWLVPGGVYLLTRRYLQFAVCAAIVCTAVGAGTAMRGSVQWPGPADLHGLDPFTTIVFRGATLAKAMAGLPFLAARSIGPRWDFLTGRVHEFGSALLILAGLVNALAISSALEREPDK